MPEIEPADKIVPRIMKQYSESPRGWRVLNTPIGEMIVVGPDSAFQLKIIPLNPQEFTGAGAELPESNSVIDSVRSSPEYGLRGLSQAELEAILESMINPSVTPSPISSIIRRDPLLPDEIEKGAIDHFLTGPVLTRPDLSDLGPEVLRMRESLDRSANKVFRKRYPMRAGMYF